MDLDTLRDICNLLPMVTEDIKWGNDLCFLIGGKMFCVTGLTSPVSVSLKVKPEQFDEMISLPGIEPAPYLARHHWVLIKPANKLSKKEWEKYIVQSYELVKSKLPKNLFKKKTK